MDLDIAVDCNNASAFGELYQESTLSFVFPSSDQYWLSRFWRRLCFLWSFAWLRGLLQLKHLQVSDKGEPVNDFFVRGACTHCLGGTGGLLFVLGSRGRR